MLSQDELGWPKWSSAHDSSQQPSSLPLQPSALTSFPRGKTYSTNEASITHLAAAALQKAETHTDGSHRASLAALSERDSANEARWVPSEAAHLV